MENGLEKGTWKCYLSSRKTFRYNEPFMFWTFSNYMVESASGHDEKNPELWLKMAKACLTRSVMLLAFVNWHLNIVWVNVPATWCCELLGVTRQCLSFLRQSFVTTTSFKKKLANLTANTETFGQITLNTKPHSGPVTVIFRTSTVAKESV